MEGQVGGSVIIRVIRPGASLELFAQMSMYPRSPKCCVRAVHQEVSLEIPAAP